MKAVVIVKSIHHQNTLKIARVMADALDARVMGPEDVCGMDLGSFDLVGFGSGIYHSKHHINILDLAEQIKKDTDKKAFLFSTCGAPAFAFDGGHIGDYIEKSHGPLRKILESKGYCVVAEFVCPGWNTNSFLKIFGGINKGRPNDEDKKRAHEFALKLKR